MPNRFPRTQMKQKAAAAAAKMLEMAHGNVYDPTTWFSVALELGCRLHPYSVPGGQPGTYRPGSKPGTGMIGFNLACSPLRQAYVLIHEIAHHLIYPHEQRALFCDVFPERYDGDENDVQHQMARMVEEIVIRARG